MEKKQPRLSSEGVNAVLRMYREVCIAENAMLNDCNRINDNYEQRKIAFEQVLELADIDEEALQRAWEISCEIRDQRWHRTANELGQIKYIQLSDEAN